MNYREFVGAVEERLNQKMEGGVTVSTYRAVKNNGKERVGVLLETPGVNISPTIYLEEYYEGYLAGKSVDLIVDGILEFYENVRRRESWDYEKVLSFEGVKDRIVFKLINTEKNRDLLERVPHMELLDLSIVFYALLEVTDEGTAAMLIENSHAGKWKVTTDTLWEMGKENVRKLLPAEFFTMNYALRELVKGRAKSSAEPENLLTDSDADRDGMYVLSNQIRNYGAACIAYPYILRMIGQILGEDYYVLPSSVHEVIIIPCSMSLRASEMDAMIREINMTQVAEEEILSDHSYLYVRSTESLMMGTRRSRRSMF